jgi:hypothetical protein
VGNTDEKYPRLPYEVKKKISVLVVIRLVKLLIFLPNRNSYELKRLWSLLTTSCLESEVKYSEDGISNVFLYNPLLPLFILESLVEI